MMKGLKKLKADKRKLVIVEEPADAQPIVQSHSPIVESEIAAAKMTGTIDMLEPNNDTLMAEKASESEPMKEDMAVKVPMYLCLSQNQKEED